MPKPNYTISAYQKNELFIKICVKAGFPIRTKQDCRKVSELIEKEGHNAISESTLYRLFLLKENATIPYLHTLNVLAQYCGFDDWSDFEAVQLSVDQFVYGFGKFKSKTPSFKSLIAICIHTDELKPLHNYTEQFEDITDADIKYKFAEEIFHAVRTNNNNDSFFKQFAQLTVIREYFFEILADPTFAIPGYESGIQYYLKGLKPASSIKDLQDFLFGNCLLFRHYFLSKSNENAKLIGKKLFVELELTNNELELIHVFPVARFFACKLMYFEMENRYVQLIQFFEWLIEYLHSQLAKYTVDEKKIIFYCLGEALVFSSILSLNHHEQLKELFRELFEYVPKRLIELSLDQIVPYFNKNSSIYHFQITE